MSLLRNAESEGLLVNTFYRVYFFASRSEFVDVEASSVAQAITKALAGTNVDAWVNAGGTQTLTVELAPLAVRKASRG